MNRTHEPCCVNRPASDSYLRYVRTKFAWRANGSKRWDHTLKIEYCSGFFYFQKHSNFSELKISADPRVMVYEFNYKIVSTEIKTILQKCKSFFFFFLDFACLKKSRVDSYLIWERVACCLCAWPLAGPPGLPPMLTVSRYIPPMMCCPQNSTTF